MIVMEVLGWVLLVLGLVVFTASAIGLFRVRTAYEVLAILSLAATIGLALLILAAICFQPAPANVVKGLIALVLQVVTTSVGSSVAGRALHLRNTPVRRAPATDPAEDA